MRFLASIEQPSHSGFKTVVGDLGEQGASGRKTTARLAVVETSTAKIIQRRVEGSTARVRGSRRPSCASRFGC